MEVSVVGRNVPVVFFFEFKKLLRLYVPHFQCCLSVNVLVFILKLNLYSETLLSNKFFSEDLGNSY